MMEESHYLFRVSNILQSVFPEDVAGKIFEAFLNTRYEQQQYVLLTWYRSWNTPKPDYYECSEHIWRRMPLDFQQVFLGYKGGFKTQWQGNAGSDIEDFINYRDWLKKHDEQNEELMPRVDDFSTKQE